MPMRMTLKHSTKASFRLHGYASVSDFRSPFSKHKAKEIIGQDGSRQKCQNQKPFNKRCGRFNSASTRCI